MKLKILVGLSVVGLVAALVAGLAFPVSSFPAEWSRWIGEGEITWLQYTGDGSKLACWIGGGPVCVLDVATGSLVDGPRATLKAYAVTADRSGRFLVIGMESEILLWDLVAGRETGRKSFTGNWCQRIVLSDDGKTLLAQMTTDLTGVPSSSPHYCHTLTICRCDLAAGTITPEHTPFECVNIGDSDLSGDGSLVAVANVADGSIQLLDSATGNELSRWPRTVPVSVRFAADPSFLVTLTGDAVERVDWKRRTVLKRHELPEDANWPYSPSIDVSLDRRTVAGIWQKKRMTDAHEVFGALQVYDTASLSPLGTAWEGTRLGLFPEEQFWNAAFSPDGRRIATISSRGRLRNWILAP
jgi:WD40 repeat protein